MNRVFEVQDSVESPAQHQEESKFLWPPLVLSILAVWILPMGTSLGLDETGTWWVVKDGLAEAIKRAQVWPAGLSIVFDAAVVGMRALAGDSDIAMRLPALIAMFIALWLLYRLGKKLIGPVGAMFACLVFATMRDIVEVASTIRPYAFGLVFVIGAMLALVNWIETGKARYGFAYAALCGLTIHAHYFLAEIFPVHAIYILLRIRHGKSRIGLKHLLAAWCGSALLTLPLLPFLRSLIAGRSSHLYLGGAGVQDLLGALAPPLLVGTLAVCGLIWLVRGRPFWIRRNIGPFSGQLIAAWAAVPVAIAFASNFVNLPIFAPRYYICAAPGLALAAGYLLSRLRPGGLRLLTASGLAVCSVLVYDINERAARGTVDWRGMAAAINQRIQSPDTPVLAVSGFIEGSRLASVLDPKTSDVLFAPYLRYPIHGALIRLPANLTDEAQPYLENIVRESLVNHDEFFVVGLASVRRDCDWLDARLRGRGFRSSLWGEFGGVGVFRFERSKLGAESSSTIPAGHAQGEQ